MYNCLKRRTLLFKRCFSATDNKECAILKQNGANYVHKKKREHSAHILIMHKVEGTHLSKEGSRQD